MRAPRRPGGSVALQVSVSALTLAPSVLSISKKRFSFFGTGAMATRAHSAPARHCARPIPHPALDRGAPGAEGLFGSTSVGITILQYIGHVTMTARQQ